MEREMSAFYCQMAAHAAEIEHLSSAARISPWKIAVGLRVAFAPACSAARSADAGVRVAMREPNRHRHAVNETNPAALHRVWR